MKSQLEQITIFLPPRRLTNFEIQKYYQNKPNFNGVYSRNNLSKIKKEAYVINRDQHESVGAHLTPLYVNSDDGSTSNDIIYFHSFEVEHILKEIYLIFHILKNVDFMLKGKSLLDYTNLFSLNEYEKNDSTNIKRFFNTF